MEYIKGQHSEVQQVAEGSSVVRVEVDNTQWPVEVDCVQLTAEISYDGQKAWEMIASITAARPTDSGKLLGTLPADWPPLDPTTSSITAVLPAKANAQTFLRTSMDVKQDLSTVLTVKEF